MEQDEHLAEIFGLDRESGGTGDEGEIEMAGSRRRDGCIPCAQCLIVGE